MIPASNAVYSFLQGSVSGYACCAVMLFIAEAAAHVTVIAAIIIVTIVSIIVIRNTLSFSYSVIFSALPAAVFLCCLYATAAFDISKTSVYYI